MAVGTSGRLGTRLSLTTARALIWPLLMSSIIGGMARHASVMWPPTSALRSGAAPVKGTCGMSTLASTLKIRSADRCGVVPGPGMP